MRGGRELDATRAGAVQPLPTQEILRDDVFMDNKFINKFFFYMCILGFSCELNAFNLAQSCLFHGGGAETPFRQTHLSLCAEQLLMHSPKQAKKCSGDAGKDSEVTLLLSA